MTAPATEMMSRIKRAKRNGTKLHLDHEHVDLLLQDDVYSLLCRYELKEMTGCAVEQKEPANDSKSADIGSGTEKTATIGISAGPKEGSRAERRQVLAVASQTARQNKRAKH
ncbi:hypothetical protein EV664_107130 [Stakelama pacifica]|uniref:Uncharacterized protein n=1 Tax=Stakelama pacifica TaxID=517720 RepID=A0A4V6PR86_9SPHN|nr:hypothetical protein EV664_107130 [Stakelama pacifica]GGO96382.1 hypothetical protein GCM10011329_22780 [Stakelama pacifica]